MRTEPDHKRQARGGRHVSTVGGRCETKAPRPECNCQQNWTHAGVGPYHEMFLTLESAQNTWEFENLSNLD